jgi:3-dehydroquinate synthase
MIKQNIQIYYEEQPSYQIFIQQDFNLLKPAIESLGFGTTRKVCVVTDSNVQKLYGNTLSDLLADLFDFCGLYVFPAGEENKNMETVTGLYKYLICNSFDRKDVLIAFGGGVVGDLTGFTAATYLRGIDFIQIPTTLLSQVDSSIGGKTGVDFLQYKNMIGAFYMPRLVYMNISLLETLSSEQFASGMGEIIKHSFIKDVSYMEFLENNSNKIILKDPTILMEMVYRSCLIKQEVVQMDPKELGVRALLNFGHTIGHAIEKLSDFTLTHGSCVTLGMVCAGYLSSKIPKGNENPFTHEAFMHMITLLERFNLPVQLPAFLKETEAITPEKILAITKLDKKMETGKIKFVLLEKLGSAYLTKELVDTQLLEGINYLWMEKE